MTTRTFLGVLALSLWTAMTVIDRAITAVTEHQELGHVTAWTAFQLGLYAGTALTFAVAGACRWAWSRRRTPPGAPSAAGSATQSPAHPVPGVPGTPNPQTGAQSPRKDTP